MLEVPEPAWYYDIRPPDFPFILFYMPVAHKMACPLNCLQRLFVACPIFIRPVLPSSKASVGRVVSSTKMEGKEPRHYMLAQAGERMRYSRRGWGRGKGRMCWQVTCIYSQSYTYHAHAQMAGEEIVGT